MENYECNVIQDLLPLYIEQLTSPETAKLVKKHLDTCSECRELYEQMKTGLYITPEKGEPDKSLLWYVNAIKMWYFLCPALAVLFLTLQLHEVLRLYEGILALVACCCLASQFCHKSTWWDPQCIELQEETRTAARTKRGRFYVKPIFIGFPAILIFLILKLPQMAAYVELFL